MSGLRLQERTRRGVVEGLEGREQGQGQGQGQGQRQGQGREKGEEEVEERPRIKKDDDDVVVDPLP